MTPISFDVAHIRHNTPISGNSVKTTRYRSSSPSFPSALPVSSSPSLASSLPPSSTILLIHESTSTISTVSKTLPPPSQDLPESRPVTLPPIFRRIRSSSPKTLAQRVERQSTALRLALKRSEASERLFTRRQDGRIVLPPLPRTQVNVASRTDSAHVPFFRIPDLRPIPDENGPRTYSAKMIPPPTYSPVKSPLPVLPLVHKTPPAVLNPRSTGEPHSPRFLSTFSQMYIANSSWSMQSEWTLSPRKVPQARPFAKQSVGSLSGVKPTVAATPVPQNFVRGWKTAQVRYKDEPPSRPSTASGSGNRNGLAKSTPSPQHKSRSRSWAHPANLKFNQDRWGNPGDSNVDTSLDIQDGRRFGMGPNDTFFLAWKSADGKAFKEKVRGPGRK